MEGYVIYPEKIFRRYERLLAQPVEVFSVRSGYRKTSLFFSALTATQLKAAMPERQVDC